MLSDPIRTLILDEQARQEFLLIDDVDLETYLAKLDAHAEIVSDCAAGRCRGFVAFYCNDLETRQAFITLIIVDPRDRRCGLGRSLIEFVLNVARRRGFTSCRLEVRKGNEAAHRAYLSRGFHVVEERPTRYLMEIGL